MPLKSQLHFMQCFLSAYCMQRFLCAYIASICPPRKQCEMVSTNSDLCGNQCEINGFFFYFWWDQNENTLASYVIESRVGIKILPFLGNFNSARSRMATLPFKKKHRMIPVVKHQIRLQKSLQMVRNLLVPFLKLKAKISRQKLSKYVWIVWWAKHRTVQLCK